MVPFLINAFDWVSFFLEGAPIFFLQCTSALIAREKFKTLTHYRLITRISYC